MICSSSSFLSIAAIALAGVGVGFLLGRRSLSKVGEQLKSNQEELQLSSDRYRLLTDNLAAAVIVRDHKGKILYCSPFTEILTGYPVSAIYASESDLIEQLVHDDDKERYRKSMQVTYHGEPFQFRFRFWHKSGILMWGESRTVPILGDNGDVISSLTITLNVTGSVRSQLQVEEKNKELHDFTYMVSHDLKSPIFTVKGMLTIIDEDFSKEIPSGMQEPLGHIRRAVNRLEQLVSSVLEYSRAASAEVIEEKAALRPLIEEVISDFSPQYKEAGGSILIEGDLPVVNADKLKLVQIFSNVISNAVKYRSPNRPLSVKISAPGGSRHQNAIVEVVDNGCGIPPDKLESVFRPFHRLHGKDIEGSGVGLACVKRLVEKLGGEISAQSDGSSGITFRISLKAAT